MSEELTKLKQEHARTEECHQSDMKHLVERTRERDEEKKAVGGLIKALEAKAKESDFWRSDSLKHDGLYQDAKLQVESFRKSHYAAAIEFLKAEAQKIPLGQGDAGKGFSSTYNALMFCARALEERDTVNRNCEDPRHFQSDVPCPACTPKSEKRVESAPRPGVCECWMSDNVGPGGSCIRCGKMPDMKARQALIDDQKRNDPFGGLPGCGRDGSRLT